MSGHDRRLAALMTEAAIGDGGSTSGILSATRGRLKRLFCFENGRIVFVASNVVEEQLDECLVQRGLISSADRSAVAREAAARKVKVTGLLMENGMVDRKAVERALEAQIANLASSSLGWPDGECRFDRGLPDLANEVRASVSPVALILDHATRFPASLDAVRARLGGPRVSVRLDPERLESLGPLDVSPAARRLIERCAEPTTVAQAVADGGESDEQILRAFYGLLLLQVLRLGKPETAAGTARAEAVSREELLSRVVSADGADHYRVLGLARGASTADVRNAYYELARRMHPDRFRTGDLSDQIEAVEAFFAKVTEAYNTLQDADRRKDYDRSLDEQSARKQVAAAESDTGFLARQNFLRGKALADRKRYNEALQFLQNAVDLDGTQARYYLALGVLQGRNPRLRDEAERNLLRVTQLEPHATQAYLSLAEIYRRAGRDDDAARMYREVLRWDEGNPDATEGLAGLGAA